MSDNGYSPSGQGINIGDVQGTGIVIGHHSSAWVGQSPSQTQQQVAAMLNEFVTLLVGHEDAILDASDVRDSALAALRETQQSSPRWSLVRTWVKGIQTSVAGVSALATAVSNVQTVLGHIPR